MPLPCFLRFSFTLYRNQRYDIIADSLLFHKLTKIRKSEDTSNLFHRNVPRVEDLMSPGMEKAIAHYDTFELYEKSLTMEIEDVSNEHIS